MAEPYKPAARFLTEKMEKRFSKDILYWRRMKLTIIDTTICEPLVSYGRFKQAVYGVKFRGDGKLLALGDHEGRIRLFSVQKRAIRMDAPKSPLRHFKAHDCPVHTIIFTCSGKTLITMGDDGIIKMWDIAETKAVPLKVLSQAHSDHIRCGDTSALCDHLFVSGSYDHTAKVWDVRAEKNESLMSVDHGFPVEQVLFFPGDAFVATAGGQYIKIWNIASGGSLFHILHNHHKTVTSMCLGSKGTCLLSGGLDKRVNVFSLDSGDYKLIQSFRMPAQVLSLSVSLDDQFMVVGMGNLLEISMRDKPGKLEESLEAANAQSAEIGFHMRMHRGICSVYQRHRGGAVEKVELSAPSVPQAKLGKVDLLLRRFKHWKAVDVLFRGKYYRSRPDIIIAALTQIYKRGALTVALSGRKSDTICPLLSFLTQNFFKPAYLPILLKTTTVLCGMYGNEDAEPRIAKMFAKLQRAVQREIEIRKKMLEFRGMLNMLKQVSDMNGTKSMDQSNAVLGEVVVTPVAFKMDENGQEKSDARPA